jgi:hypothetical protein
MAGCGYSAEHKIWFHQIRLGGTDLRAQHAGGRLFLDDIHAEILSLLRKYPFSLMWTTVESLGIPVSPILSHLIETSVINFLLRWVPHMSTNELWQKRVEVSGQLLRVLESQQRVGFSDIVTGGKS